MRAVGFACMMRPETLTGIFHVSIFLVRAVLMYRAVAHLSWLRLLVLHRPSRHTLVCVLGMRAYMLAIIMSDIIGLIL